MKPYVLVEICQVLWKFCGERFLISRFYFLIKTRWENLQVILIIMVYRYENSLVTSVIWLNFYPIWFKSLPLTLFLAGKRRDQESHSMLPVACWETCLYSTWETVVNTFIWIGCGGNLKPVLYRWIKWMLWCQCSWFIYLLRYVVWCQHCPIWELENSLKFHSFSQKWKNYSLLS